MKDYKRLTEEHINDAEFCSGCSFDDDLNGCEIGGCEKYYMYFEKYERLRKLEDKIESGELCDRKETAEDILLLLGKGFDETTRKNFKDLPWYKQFCRELKFRYGVELFGNFDRVKDEE